MAEPKKIGRPKGVPNRNFLHIRGGLQKAKFDVVTEFLKVYANLETPMDKLDALKFLMPYVVPKFKDVEVTTDVLLDMIDDSIDVTPDTMSNEELLQSLAEVGPAK